MHLFLAKCGINCTYSSLQFHAVKITYVGIVVGAWPCGTIVMMGQLFRSESKSQVYGHVHTFLKRILRQHLTCVSKIECLSSNVTISFLRTTYVIMTDAI